MRRIIETRGDVLTLSVSTFLLYLVLAGTVDTFEIVTGGISALVVGVLFANVSFDTPPSVRRTPLRVARCVLFVPYLFWEIMKANVGMAYLILHPALPINPRFRRYETADRETIELSVLAMSITLTPGTLVSDVVEGSFEIHLLSDDAWNGLLSGTLERAVGFIFAGRSAFDEEPPRERMHGRANEPLSTTDD